MTLPDLDNLTVSELNQLVGTVVTRIHELEALAVDDQKSAKEAVINARSELSALLGPIDAVPGTDSIRAVLAYGDEFIIANAPQAVPLVVHGMETLTAVLVELTKALSTN